MPKNFILIAVLAFSLPLFAQHKKEKIAIKKVIATFFKGLHQGDSTLLKTTLHNDIKLQTIVTRKKGEPELKTETKSNLLKAITKIKAKDVYLEKLLSYTIQIDGNLASVWTPYEFSVNGKFSHCGANSFQFFKDNGNWKIIYLVDTRRRADCKDAKQKK